MTEVSKERLFAYKGYRIPIEFVDLTGGGVDTWDAISVGHMEQYAKYALIDKDASVLEVGCGVGRDAIQLTEHLSSEGTCQANITRTLARTTILELFSNPTNRNYQTKSQIYPSSALRSQASQTFTSSSATSLPYRGGHPLFCGADASLTPGQSSRIAAFRCLPVAAQNASRIRPFSFLPAVW